MTEELTFCLSRFKEGQREEGLAAGGLRGAAAAPQSPQPSVPPPDAPRHSYAKGFISNLTAALYRSDSSERHKFSPPQWPCQDDNDS